MALVLILGLGEPLTRKPGVAIPDKLSCARSCLLLELRAGACDSAAGWKVWLSEWRPLSSSCLLMLLILGPMAHEPMMHETPDTIIGDGFTMPSQDRRPFGSRQPRLQLGNGPDLSIFSLVPNRRRLDVANAECKLVAANVQI